MFLLTKIKSIKKLGITKTIDIEVSGNKLFVANGILTHNSGYDSSDPSLTDTSESFGTPATADLQLALISTEQLADQGLLLIKQLKNRYSDVSHNRRFTITVDKSKMRLGNDPNQQFLSSITPQLPNVKSVSPTPNFNNTKNSKFDPGDDSIIF